MNSNNATRTPLATLNVGANMGNVHAAPARATYVDIGVDTEDMNSAYPNFSAWQPPDPEVMIQPLSTIYYYVVMAGERVGIFEDQNDLKVWHLPRLHFYCMKRFESWNGAFAYYQHCFRAGEVHLTSTFLACDGSRLAPASSAGLGATRNTATSAIPARSGAPNTNGPPVWNLANTTAFINPASLFNPAPAAPVIPIKASSNLGPPTMPCLSASAVATQVASPFGGEDQPITISSPFPTPIPPSGSKARPISIAERSAKVARFRQKILEAMTSPTPKAHCRSSGSKPQSPKGKNSAPTKSSAATRIRRRSKGKAKAIDVIMTDEDESESAQNSHNEILPSAPSDPAIALASSSAPPVPDNHLYIWGFSDDEGEPPRPRTSNQFSMAAPHHIQVTLAPSFPAQEPNLQEPHQSCDPFLDSPFHFSPINRHRRSKTPQPRNSPEGHLCHNTEPPSFEELVKIATKTPTKTPKATASQAQLAIIKETLSKLQAASIPGPNPRTPSPLPGSEIRLAHIQNAFAEHAMRNQSASRTPTRSPSAFFHLDLFAPSIESTPLSFPSSSPSSSGSEFGLSSELTADCIEAAAIYLDQTYSKA